MRARVGQGLLMILMAALVGCDHATKVVAKVTLDGGAPRVLIPGMLDLVYTENHDTAFSLLRAFTSPAKGSLIVVMASLAIVAVAVAWWTRRRVGGLLEHSAFALVIAGALGNVLDRMQRGYVVDFIHVQFWPVFNVADIAVCVGGGLVGIALMRWKSSHSPSSVRSVRD
jgi:signal peptidase II